jgi:hypothetical protein
MSRFLLVVLSMLMSACSPSEKAALAKAPGIRIVDERAVVNGCEGKLDWNAEGTCPMLFCEAAILNGGAVDPYADIELHGGPTTDDRSRWLIVGTARLLRTPEPPRSFVHCLLEQGKVVRSGVMSEREYNAVRYNGEWL